MPKARSLVQRDAELGGSAWPGLPGSRPSLYRRVGKGKVSTSQLFIFSKKMFC